jgi:hypothetical protein
MPGSMPNTFSVMHTANEGRAKVSFLNVPSGEGSGKEGVREGRISFEIYDHNGGRSKSMAAKDRKRSSVTSSFLKQLS